MTLDRRSALQQAAVGLLSAASALALEWPQTAAAAGFGDVAGAHKARQVVALPSLCRDKMKHTDVCALLGITRRS